MIFPFANIKSSFFILSSIFFLLALWQLSIERLVDSRIKFIDKQIIPIEMGIFNWNGTALLCFALLLFDLCHFNQIEMRERKHDPNRNWNWFDEFGWSCTYIKNKFRHSFNLIAIFLMAEHQPISSIPILFMAIIISERQIFKKQFSDPANSNQFHSTVPCSQAYSSLFWTLISCFA